MTDPFEDICHDCGAYDKIIAANGLFYCKWCFKRKYRNSRKFREICEQIGIGKIVEH